MNLDHHFAPLLDVFPGSAEGERGGGGSERGREGARGGSKRVALGGSKRGVAQTARLSRSETQS